MKEQIRITQANKLFFKKFSRKGFAAFNSMHKVVHILTLACTCSLVASPLRLDAQGDTSAVSKTLELEEVEVVGELGPVVSLELPRLVSVISSDESSCSPHQSITDLLRFAGNIDLRQRGKSGIQSDLSIRGGSFDHSMILLNGIPINDPQTGHLSLNLPIETDALKRIEILNGSAASRYGAQAFSGAVNFTTSPSESNSLTISSAAGQYSFLKNSVSLNLGSEKIRNLLHYNHAFSDGYTLNTDYSRQGIFYHSKLEFGDNELDIQFGHNDRAFGANGFYTPKYPDQFERNTLWFGSMSYETGKKIRIAPQLYWRKHRDQWEMFRVGEDWYRVEQGMSISNVPERTTFDSTFIYTNHHVTDVIGGRLSLKKSYALGTTLFGLHFRSERIMSNAIGTEMPDAVPVRGFDNTFYTHSDQRSNLDLNLQQIVRLKRFYIAAGTMVNWNSYLSDEINFFPGVDVRFKLNPSIRMVAGYSYNLGIPTFTDLSYRDPSNEGDASLQPYSQHSLEAGFHWFSEKIHASALVFASKGSDVIDWVWFSDINKFRPVNIESYASQGLEVTGRYDSHDSHLLKNIQFGYTFLNMDKEVPGEIMKYQNIRHKMNLMISTEPIRNLVIALNIYYINREGSYLTYNFTTEEYEYNPYQSYFLSDLRSSYSIRFLTIFAEVSNLFNKEYIDIGSINQPGRWITAGLKLRLVGEGKAGSPGI